MREIGGYIEFESYNGTLLHEDALALNSGRSCLAYLIHAKQIGKIVLPYFLCDSVINLCKKEHVSMRYYHIDDTFMPVDVQLEDGEWLYLVNYYGQLTATQVATIVKTYQRVIVDNAQAYFDKPLPSVDTIYTCRKFFGVADGAFLYTDRLLEEELPCDESYDRMRFLLGRYERTANEFYDEYTKNNRMFAAEEVKKMSKLTKNLLRGIDYEGSYGVRAKRSKNYLYLYKAFLDKNLLTVRLIEGAFAYPLLLEDGAYVRSELQKRKIYIPTLWPNVLASMAEETLEYQYAKHILPIPCDQRYGKEEMQYVCDVINEVIMR